MKTQDEVLSSAMRFVGHVDVAFAAFECNNWVLALKLAQIASDIYRNDVCQGLDGFAIMGLSSEQHKLIGIAVGRMEAILQSG